MPPVETRFLEETWFLEEERRRPAHERSEAGCAAPTA